MAPIKWKVIFCPIPKDKTKSLYHPLNYRRISILICIAELFICFMSNKVNFMLRERKIDLVQQYKYMVILLDEHL